ncbi:MAG TPA: VWA domain-containing protein [Phycisphaerae bacterium]|nr:VWA domain-containing protein [Phycisphaerae bacterium]HOI54324.1 VWA domain-containing protein [Phycisphaerae bacterium]
MADQQGAKVKGIVDIVFLIDATGSMQPCIDALKANISTFIDTLTTPNANNQAPVKHWRAKAVGYRDFGSDQQPLIDHPFVEDAAAIKAQLAEITAEGGGDEAESLLDALYRVATMEQTGKGGQFEPTKWRYRSDAARVVIVFTDAPYKDVMTSPAGGTFDDLKNAIHGNRIILSIFAPNLPCYDLLAGLDKSELMAYDFDASDLQGSQKALAEFTADRENFRQTLVQLAKSVSKSAEVPSL